MSLALTPTMEDYLETIIALESKKKAVRVKDIAEALEVKMSSVTSAIGKLAEKELVNHEKYGYVELTPTGQKVASDIRRRHETLFRFLSETLNIDSEIAEKDACKMEHGISPTTLERLVKFIQFVEHHQSGIFAEYLDETGEGNSVAASKYHGGSKKDAKPKTDENLRSERERRHRKNACVNKSGSFRR